jgi:hypothetical protein
MPLLSTVAAVAVGAAAKVKAAVNKNADIAIIAFLCTGRPALGTIPPVGRASEEIIEFSSAGQLVIIVAPVLVRRQPP